MIGVNVQVRLFNKVMGHSIFFLVLQTLRRDCVHALTCLSLNKASIGVLWILSILLPGIWDTVFNILFTFRDIGYLEFYPFSSETKGDIL